MEKLSKAEKPSGPGPSVEPRMGSPGAKLRDWVLEGIHRFEEAVGYAGGAYFEAGEKAWKQALKEREKGHHLKGLALTLGASGASMAGMGILTLGYQAMPWRWLRDIEAQLKGFYNFLKSDKTIPEVLGPALERDPFLISKAAGGLIAGWAGGELLNAALRGKPLRFDDLLEALKKLEKMIDFPVKRIIDESRVLDFHLKQARLLPFLEQGSSGTF